MKPFSCTHCRSTVFFENTRCGSCGSTLGFWPARRRMVAFRGDACSPGPWPAAGRGGGRARLRPCANRVDHGSCNWMLDADDPDELCRSCRLNDLIPDLSQPGHLKRWATVERAKRRLAFTLLGLGLMPEPKRDVHDEAGLAFCIVAPVDGAPVLTGHAHGVITLNVMEADDLHREAARVAFDEPWRTVLGHLRHEISHYLHHRWIAGVPALEQRWRGTFGDERSDYAQALERHHALGPPPDWATRCISAYASAHPHEDWAETCAHLLLALDAVQTADAWGLTLSSRAARATPRVQALSGAGTDELLLGHWLPVAQFLNAMSRSLGLPDSYPFQLPPAVVHKLEVAAELLAAAARRSDPFTRAG